MGVFAPVVGIIGSIQAAEALKLLSGVGESLSGRLQWLDVRTMQWRSVNAARPGMSGLRTPARLKIHAVPYRLQPVSPACYWLAANVWTENPAITAACPWIRAGAREWWIRD